MIPELQRLLSPGQVLHGEAVRRAYAGDAYPVEKSPPACVVLPEDTAQVQQVVRWCLANGVPFTPRGAGTGLSGGAMPALGGVVISTKRMTRILDVDLPNRCLLAQTGIPNLRISDAVRAQGLHFAPDPSSQSVSTLGGNIAENSGGPHTLKYGVTAQHVLGVTLVDPQGEVLELGGRLPGCTGYDLLGQVVGSEGTLGIVTEAWVRLTPLPTAVETAVAEFAEPRQASEAVAEIIASGVIPAALEIMDRGILDALASAFGLRFTPGTGALLLVEVDSALADTEAAREVARAEMASVRGVCERKGATDFRIAHDEAERQELWRARKKGIGAMGRVAPTIVTHDGVIPRSKLPEMLEFVYEVADRHGLTVANLFHAGDGNLHPVFAYDERVPGMVERVVAAGEEILRRCLELGGSVTGEHGIGVEKLDFMPLMFSPEDLRLQADIKRIFGESELCNPCKVLPDQKGCVEHRARWRGAAW